MVFITFGGKHHFFGDKNYIMKLNLDKYLEQEIILAFEIFRGTGYWKSIDYYALERKFQTTEGEKTVIIVLYNELLSYNYVWDEGGVHRSEQVTTPWICCRITLDGKQNTPWHYKILKDLKKWAMEELPWKPFRDEDATHMIYSKATSPYDRNETQYKFYINPDYPNGWWENHTLG